MQQALDGIRAYRQRHAAAIIRELVEFVRQPNNVFVASEIQANARFLQGLMERRGIRTRLLETASGRPAVFGELLTEGATTTILCYGHYDGVPVERDQWHSDPYEPVLRAGLPRGEADDWSTMPLEQERYAESWRLFGRSVADSKNTILAILTALDALRALGRAVGVNLKFLFDGEEEQESPGLAACLAAHKEQLQADFLISCSGETHQSGLPTIEFGVRGILQFDLTAYTSTVELHSGHFGNFGPNAAFRLAELLTAMKDRDGRVLIPGFYDQVVPLTAAELEAIDRIPRIEGRIQSEFGIARPDGSGAILQRLVNQPTLNVRGLTAGYVGEAGRNIIPRTALAEFDVRLVKGMEPEATLAAIVAHIEAQGWTVLLHQPSREELLAHERVIHLNRRAGFPSTRTPLDSPVAQMVVRAVARAVDQPVVVMPSEGGSLPLYLFEQIGIPFVGLPTSNFDCNQHTADENLQLGYLFQAIDLFGSLFLGA